jgi:hypothetical protein
MSGASLQEIAEILGHKTLSMVQRYAHLTDAHTSQVVLRMSEKFAMPSKIEPPPLAAPSTDETVVSTAVSAAAVIPPTGPSAPIPANQKQPSDLPTTRPQAALSTPSHQPAGPGQKVAPGAQDNIGQSTKARTPARGQEGKPEVEVIVVRKAILRKAKSGETASVG